MSAKAREIANGWYDEDWCHHITQDEVQALVDQGRLMHFTHTWNREQGWQRRDDGYVPTAAEVNAWSVSGMGHDGINRWICVTQRCKRLGIEVSCKHCDDGQIWVSPEVRRLHNEWERVEPPTGEGWQVWETVSEGSPITPVFATAEELAKHLSDDGDCWMRPGDTKPTYEAALKFVKAGWAASPVPLEAAATS